MQPCVHNWKERDSRQMSSREFAVHTSIWQILQKYDFWSIFSWLHRVLETVYKMLASENRKKSRASLERNAPLTAHKKELCVQNGTKSQKHPATMWLWFCINKNSRIWETFSTISKSFCWKQTWFFNYKCCYDLLSLFKNFQNSKFINFLKNLITYFL